MSLENYDDSLISPDILLEVVEFCSPKELCALAVTCKYVNNILSSDSVWKTLFSQRYGDETSKQISLLLTSFEIMSAGENFWKETKSILRFAQTEKNKQSYLKYL